MTTWDSTVDFVIVGSGGGGMVAALTAHEAGASTIVLEKQGLVGGSTAMSGGVVWVPDNPVMRADGIPDSYEDGMAHFDAVVGDVGPASSFERRHAFLTAGPEMISFLQGLGVGFVHCLGYSDYYSNAKGGVDEGRAVEPLPWDGRALGAWLDKLQPGLAQSLGLAVMTNEARSLSNYNRSVGAFAVSARVALRTFAARGTRAGAPDQRRLVDRTDAGHRDRSWHPGVDGRAARRADHRRRRGRRSAHGTSGSTRADPGPTGRAVGRRGLRAQPGDARRVRRRSTEPGQVVDRQPGRHR